MLPLTLRKVRRLPITMSDLLDPASVSLQSISLDYLERKRTADIAKGIESLDDVYPD